MSTATAWRAAMATDTGLQRPNNEDRVYVDERQGIFIVVDGVGGHSAGEKAAEIAVEVIPRELGTSGNIEQRVRSAITAANNEIYRAAEENPDWGGMACVLTLAIAEDDKVTVGHVGDSRLYLVWNGAVKKLTSDHSPVGEQEDQGELTELEAMEHPRRNEVFRDVGSRPHEPYDEEFIQIKSFPLHPEAALLLCSDGLSDVLTSAEISSIVEQYDGEPSKIAEMLVDAANAAGGKDNVSVIFIAGPEFVGCASRSMAEARSRHAITRMRSGRRRWRRWIARAAWLLAGIVLGAAFWAWLVDGRLWG